MNENQTRYSPEDIKALKEAVRHTDISFFGPLFDFYLDTSRSETPGLYITRGEDEQRAFEATIRNPIIQRVGIEAIIEAFKENKHGTGHFSNRSKDFLNRYIKELSESQTPLNPHSGQKDDSNPQG